MTWNEMKYMTSLLLPTVRVVQRIGDANKSLIIF